MPINLPVFNSSPPPTVWHLGTWWGQVTGRVWWVWPSQSIAVPQAVVSGSGMSPPTVWPEQSKPKPKAFIRGSCHPQPLPREASLKKGPIQRRAKLGDTTRNRPRNTTLIKPVLELTKDSGDKPQWISSDVHTCALNGIFSNVEPKTS